jgi:hypothetical protein
MWLILSSLLLSACAEVPAAALAHLPACYPARNVYADSIDNEYINIYNKGVASINNDIGLYNKYRQDAFDQLVDQVYHWSDSVDINVGDTEGKPVRVTITYVSPRFLHLIILNHYLYKKISYPPQEVEEHVQSQMSRIISNEEHIFFIVFLAPHSNDGTTIEFPIKELSLKNANNLTSYVEHADHNLEGPISITTEPEYGFFYIPMTVMKDGSCKTVLDKDHETRIFLNVPKITIDGAGTGLLSWEYKYAPIIDMATISGTHQVKFLLAQQVDLIAPDTGQLTSISSQQPFVDLNGSNYWVALARFIWYVTTLDP